MKIKQGFYPLTMVRQLLLTRDWAGNIVFLVTLRDDAEPYVFPSVHTDGWLWLTEDSIARVEFNRFDPIVEAITYIEAFQTCYFDADVPAVLPNIVGVSEVVTVGAYQEFISTLDGNPLILEGFPQHVYGKEMIALELRYIVAKYVNEIRRGKDIYCVQDMGFPPQALFSFRDQQCTVFEMAPATGLCEPREISKHVFDLKEYLFAISPDILQPTTEIGERQLNECEKSTNRNPVAQPKKIRNASISGMRLPIGERPKMRLRDIGDQVISEVSVDSADTVPLGSLSYLQPAHFFSGQVSDARREMGRSLGPRELPNGFHPSDKDLHGPDGELLARGIPGRGSNMSIDMSQPVNLSYASELRQMPEVWHGRTPKTDGPVPAPVEIPWVMAIRLFNNQIVNALVHEHNMSYGQACQYVNLHAEREDDDKILRKVMSSVKPLASLW